jgi:phospholipid/cholesterol/gamma-HCH transport system substrate-binding protein
VAGLAADRQPIGQAISSIGDLTQVTAGFLDDARPSLKSDIAALGDLSTQLDAGGPTIEKYLRTAPDKLNTIARAASYGSWFQFYLCSASGTIGAGDIVPAQTIPVFHSDSPRCGPDPAGLS